jgi:hypothetical protein
MNEKLFHLALLGCGFLSGLLMGLAICIFVQNRRVIKELSHIGGQAKTQEAGRG